MASAALTVDPHDKIISPELPRLAASSLRFWFHAVVYWTTVCCHSSIRPSKSHGGPRQTRLGRWPWNTRRSSMRLAFPWARVFLFVRLLLECRPFFWSHRFMIVLKPSMGPLAHEDLNPEIYSPDPELSEIRPGFELKSFSIFIPGKLCLSSLVLAPPQEH